MMMAGMVVARTKKIGINFGALLIALIAFGLYLTIRSRAAFHILRAAYPQERIEFRRIWAAYIAAYGFNNVIPRSLVTMNNGRRLWIISEEMSINILTNPSTQIPDGIFFSVVVFILIEIIDLHQVRNESIDWHE